MGGFIDFLVNNYLIFLLITLVLIFALIGYLVESKKERNGETVDANGNENSIHINNEKTEEDLKEEIKRNAKQVSINEAVGEKPKVNEEIISENNSSVITEIPSIPKSVEANTLDSLNEEQP